VVSKSDIDERQALNQQAYEQKDADDKPTVAQQVTSSSDKDILIAELLDQLRIERDRNDYQQKRIEKLERQWNEDREQWNEDRERWNEDRERWNEERSNTKKQIEDLNKKIEDLGLQLKKQMGIIPSSEKGALLKNQDATTGDDSGNGDGTGDGDNNGRGADRNALPPDSTSVHEIRYQQAISRPRPEIPEGLRSAASLQEWLQAIDSDPECIPAPAKIFGTPVVSFIKDRQDFCFTTEERQELFGTIRGLYSRKLPSTVYDFQIQVKKIDCYREVLMDLASGVRHTKEKLIAPKGSRLSWSALAKISTLVAEYAFPMERLSTAIGISYFSSENISRWFAQSAHKMLIPYIELGKKLGKLPYLKTDDTSALVLEMRTAAQSGLKPDCHMTGEEWQQYLEERAERLEKNNVDLVTKVIEAFGRVSQKARGDGAKTSVNTTIVSGRLDPCDYRSMVYFYRTHFGQAGNLLSRILEYRPKNNSEKITIQGDLSAQNHVEAAIAEHLTLIYIGCTSHARRPFHRYRNRDRQLCFFMLRCFAVLARVEILILAGPMTKERILRLRGRYSAKVWSLMKDVCKSVINGERHPLADNQVWKKGDKLYEGSAYIVNHFEELTYYITHAHIDADNNSSEQGLRGEKLIEGASYFRQTENGRIALDIHRTMIACCNVCGLGYDTYMRYVAEADEKDIKADPERFFPYAVAQALSAHDPPGANDQHQPQEEPTIH